MEWREEAGTGNKSSLKEEEAEAEEKTVEGVSRERSKAEKGEREDGKRMRRSR